jgi:hypothetical protein
MDAFRSDLADFTPTIATMTIKDLEQNERDRERQTRRAKRQTRGRNRDRTTLPEREALPTSRTLVPKPGGSTLPPYLDDNGDTIAPIPEVARALEIVNKFKEPMPVISRESSPPRSIKKSLPMVNQIEVPAVATPQPSPSRGRKRGAHLRTRGEGKDSVSPDPSAIEDNVHHNSSRSIVKKDQTEEEMIATLLEPKLVSRGVSEGGSSKPKIVVNAPSPYPNSKPLPKLSLENSTPISSSDPDDDESNDEPQEDSDHHEEEGQPVTTVVPSLPPPPPLSDLGLHSNFINGVWHCMNCGLPDELADGKGKGPAGNSTLCSGCGEYSE